jgi:hypothetical protein
MASTLRTLVERVKTVLRGIDGGPTYTYDLTGSVDDVDYGDTMDASPPAIRITTFFLDSAESATLTRYKRDAVVNLMGYVGADTDSPGDRMLAAADLANDIHLAIEADRVAGVGSLGSLTTTVVVTADVLDGNSLGIDNLGIVAATVTMSYRATTGI